MDALGKMGGIADGVGGPSRCPRCGAVVTCGAMSTPKADVDEVRCWCLDWPHLPVAARTGALACLCPACLRAALLDAGVVIDDTAADPARAVAAGTADRSA
jgi:hypothetical protein